MKRIKKLGIILSLCLVFSSIVPSILPYNTAVKVDASTVKLNKSKLTLYVGKTSKLKIKGTSKKVTWSTTKKSVATVSKSGKVTAKKAGKATIKATVNGKKYTCRVTVKNAKEITYEGAKKIALKRAGGGIVTDIDLDYENGRLVYEVEVYYKGVEYEIYIDAKTGKVLICNIDY